MVRIFQPSSEIYVLGGPNISKYKDPWETNNFRGVHIFQLTCEIYVRGVQIFRNIRTRGNHFGGVQIFYDSSFCMDAGQ